METRSPLIVPNFAYFTENVYGTDAPNLQSHEDGLWFTLSSLRNDPTNISLVPVPLIHNRKSTGRRLERPWMTQTVRALRIQSMLQVYDGWDPMGGSYRTCTVPHCWTFLRLNCDAATHRVAGTSRKGGLPMRCPNGLGSRR